MLRMRNTVQRVTSVSCLLLSAVSFLSFESVFAVKPVTSLSHVTTMSDDGLTALFVLQRNTVSVTRRRIRIAMMGHVS